MAEFGLDSFLLSSHMYFYISAYLGGSMSVLMLLSAIQAKIKVDH